LTTNRKDIRSAIKSALTGHVPSAQVLYGYLPHTFNHESPVVCLSSSGTNRIKLTQQGYAPLLFVNIHIFVSYGSATDDSWTEEQAEDALDTVEMEVADALLAASTSNLKFIWVDRSFADEPVEDSGETYLHEIIPISVKAVT